jgi:hypothetical protein
MENAVALFVSAVGVALGAFVAVEPARAAQIWGSERLKNLAPQHRASFLLWFRAFGIVLCLGAALVALESR